MKPAKKKVLLDKLEQEIKKAKKGLLKTKKAARVFKTASRSQQGDKLYHENSFHMAQDYLARVLDLEKEIRNTPDKTPEKVQSVSFVTVEYQDGNTSSYFLAPIGLRLADIFFVTPESPLGKAIIGKKEGEGFSFKIETENGVISRSGRIKKIE